MCMYAHAYLDVARVYSSCTINVACPYAHLDGLLDALDPRLLVLGEGVAQRQARLCGNEEETRGLRLRLLAILRLRSSFSAGACPAPGCAPSSGLPAYSQPRRQPTGWAVPAGRTGRVSDREAHLAIHDGKAFGARLDGGARRGLVSSQPRQLQLEVAQLELALGIVRVVRGLCAREECMPVRVRCWHGPQVRRRACMRAP